MLDSIHQRTGMNLRVFFEKQTWYAFLISVVLFFVIAYSGLTVFGMTTSKFGVTDDAQMAPNFEMLSLNRTGIESNYTNDTGWFELEQHRGKVVILDFMAHDCLACHGVQAHLEEHMSIWQDLDTEYELLIVAVGAWYDEPFDYLNESSGGYHVPYYFTGKGSVESVIVNETTGERGDLREHYNAWTIPVAYVIDHEGYLIAKNTGSGLQWNEFDSAVVSALNGEAEDLRFGLSEVDTSVIGIFTLGLLLSILVYFSPCAFPVLPSFITYYLSLGSREEDLIEQGKLKGKMPKAWVIGLLSGFGMWTFFLFIGIIAVIMGEAFEKSGIITQIAFAIAVLLVALGFFMLTGGTAHLMGWVQKYIDRWSTTENDEIFTPRRNMYLYGIGYAAASIDCTAAAVLPFIIYLSTQGGNSVPVGLSGLMLGLLLLMISVTVAVSLGRQVMIDFLRKATGIIKMIGSWMMMFAGIGLLLLMSNPELLS
jgi:cytochrome c-type biogenesis protein